MNRLVAFGLAASLGLASNRTGRLRMGSGEWSGRRRRVPWSCRRSRGSRSCRWRRGSRSCPRGRRARSLWRSSLCARCQAVGPRSLLRRCRRRCYDGRNHRHNGSAAGASASAVLVLVQPGPKPRLLGLLFLTGESMQNPRGHAGLRQNLIIVGGPEARIARTDCAVVLFQRICCFLFMRLAMISLTTLDERRGNRLTAPPPGSVVHQRADMGMIAVPHWTTRSSNFRT
jgi:hypothetical protein